MANYRAPFANLSSSHFTTMVLKIKDCLMPPAPLFPPSSTALAVFLYSGLTKTSTALPRLAVLFVL
ncbi:hypothetical protein FD684_11190, partial [Neisseria meningitidis]